MSRSSASASSSTAPSSSALSSAMFSASSSSLSAAASSRPPPSPTLMPQHQPPKRLLDMHQFWVEQMDAIEHLDYSTLHHELPLARLKRIMKVDQARMISSETPLLFAKACELFILDLTVRAWASTKGTSRTILQKSDVLEAIERSETFDFLLDFFSDELLDAGDHAGLVKSTPTTGDSIADAFEKRASDRSASASHAISSSSSSSSRSSAHHSSTSRSSTSSGSSSGNSRHTTSPGTAGTKRSADSSSSSSASKRSRR